MAHLCSNWHKFCYILRKTSPQFFLRPAIQYLKEIWPARKKVWPPLLSTFPRLSFSSINVKWQNNSFMQIFLFKVYPATTSWSTLGTVNVHYSLQNFSSENYISLLWIFKKITHSCTFQYSFFPLYIHQFKDKLTQNDDLLNRFVCLRI